MPGCQGVEFDNSDCKRLNTCRVKIREKASQKGAIRVKGSKKMCPLGKKIVIEAAKRNMTMNELAEYLGISSYAYLYRIVYGKVGVGEKYAAVISEFIGEEILIKHRGRSA